MLLEASSQSFSSSSLYPVHLPTNLLPLCPAVAHYIGRQQQQQQGNLILHQANDCCPQKLEDCVDQQLARTCDVCVLCNLDPSLTISATWILHSRCLRLGSKIALAAVWSPQFVVTKANNILKASAQTLHLFWKSIKDLSLTNNKRNIP